MEVLQRRPKRDRPACHTAVLRITHIGGGDGQDRHSSVRRRTPRHTDIPNHADTAHTQVGPALNRTSKSWVHITQLVQRARPAHVVSGHGRTDILQPGVLC